MANIRKSDYKNDFPHISTEVRGPKNLGEVQAREVPSVGKAGFGNYVTADWSKGRNISTTGGTGESRKYDHFYEKRTMQDFLDEPKEIKKKMKRTYGGE